MHNFIPNHLKENEQVLWRDYERQIAQGKRKTLAPQTLQKLISGIKAYSDDQRKQWVEEFLHKSLEENDNLNIPLPLFEEIILVNLNHGFDKGESHYARWIGQTYDLIIRATKHNPEIKKSPDIDNLYPMNFFEIAYKQNPEDKIAQIFLIREYTTNLDFAIHEVPIGLLADIDWFRDTLIKLQRLLSSPGLSEKYKNKINLWVFHINAWEDYLARRNGYKHYVDYLEKNANGFNWRFYGGLNRI